MHEDLKRGFIADMVEHKEEWLSNFNLDRDDLREVDQKSYDEQEEELIVDFSKLRVWKVNCSRGLPFES